MNCVAIAHAIRGKESSGLAKPAQLRLERNDGTRQLEELAPGQPNQACSRFPKLAKAGFPGRLNQRRISKAVAPGGSFWRQQARRVDAQG
jgi:hypothetical protein